MCFRKIRTYIYSNLLVEGLPLARLGLSEEVADGIVYIASDEASFVTGHVLNVDGGHTAN
jgi:NAD(P)-dependent dehydrogenase (short-subunit alcohol dehydrogenase family)